MNIIYTQEQINTVVQLMNSIQITGVENCMRISEIVRILNTPQPDTTSTEVSDEDKDRNENEK